MNINPTHSDTLIGSVDQKTAKRGFLFMGKRINIKRDSDYEVELVTYFREFIEFKEAANLSEATITSYKKSYKRFVEWFNNAYENTSLTINLLDDKIFYRFIDHLKNKMCKPASINHYLRDLRAFTNWLDTNSYTDTPIRINLIKGQEEEFKCYTNEELLLLLEKPRKQDSFVVWRTWTIVNFILGTGQRSGTVRDVRVGDIDFRNKQIRIRHTKNKKVMPPIPLSRQLNLALKEYIKIFRGNSSAEDFLFCDVSDEQLSESALRNSYRKYVLARNVNTTSLHSLRHTFARSFLMNNGDVFRLQKILGHQTLEMTRRYCNLLGEDLKQDFEAFNPLDNLKRDKRHKVQKNEYI